MRPLGAETVGLCACSPEGSEPTPTGAVASRTRVAGGFTWPLLGAGCSPNSFSLAQTLPGAGAAAGA